MLSVDYLCCCLPLINTGIYFILLEQLALSIICAVLSVATSGVVGSTIPGFTPWIFAVICFAVAAVQVVGLIGVVQEKKRVFKTYMFLNLVGVLFAFVVAAVLILVSGLRNQTGITNCQQNFYGGTSTNSTTSLSQESDTVCKIFVLTDLGLMGGLWLLLAIVQGYFLAVINVWKREQEQDHNRYFSMYSTKGGFPEAENIPLSSTQEGGAGDVWTARESMDAYRHSGYAPQTYDDNVPVGGYSGNQQYPGGGYNDGGADDHQQHDGSHGERGFQPPQDEQEGYGEAVASYPHAQQQQEHYGAGSSGGYPHPAQYDDDDAYGRRR